MQSGLCDGSPQPVLASPATYHTGQSAVCTGGGPHPWCYIRVICCGLPAVSVFFALFWSVAHLQLPKTPQCCCVVTSRLTATIVLWHSMTSLWSWGVFVVGATGDTLCPVMAVLSYLSVRPNRQGSQFICIRMFAHCHRLIWWQQFVKTRLQMVLMCHISMAIVFGLELLPPWPRLVSQTPSFFFWVTGSPPHS